MPALLHRSTLPGRGFTLIEVTIVVALLAIIAAVALPSYFDSVRKARRADAYNAINKAQQAQERYRANSPYFGTAWANLGLSTFAAASAASPTSFDGADGYYTVVLVAPTSATPSSTTYELVAFAKSGTSQLKDVNCQCLKLIASGGQITYQSAGTAGPFNGTLAGCGSFGTTNANRCWRR